MLPATLSNVLRGLFYSMALIECEVCIEINKLYWLLRLLVFDSSLDLFFDFHPWSWCYSECISLCHDPFLFPTRKQYHSRTLHLKTLLEKLRQPHMPLKHRCISSESHFNKLNRDVPTEEGEQKLLCTKTRLACQKSFLEYLRLLGVFAKLLCKAGCGNLLS